MKYSAVKEGFEPSVHFKAYDSLANYWFRPLTHLTIVGCKLRSQRYLRTYPFQKRNAKITVLMRKQKIFSENLYARQLYFLLYLQQVLFIVKISVHKVFHGLAGVYHCCMVKTAKVFSYIF